MNFKNSAKRIDPSKNRLDRGAYAYDKPSPLLYVWSQFLQCVISVAATKMLTGKWHTSHYGIYKCEGGCNLPGVNDLVLLSDVCYFDFGRGEKQKISRCAELISEVVLNWNPNDPIDSILSAAAKFIGETLEDFRKAVEENYGKGNLFGGDALSSFFDYNPFGKFPTDRKYLRFCLVKFNDMTDEEVTQQFADEDLGDELLDRMRKKLRKDAGDAYCSFSLCCNPSRKGKELTFWINDGTQAPINGWRTQEQIESFIADPKGFSVEEVK